MYRDELIPPIYAKDGERPLHDDWKILPFNILPQKYQPWTKIPRTCNFFGFDMGPKVFSGSRGVRYEKVEVQPGYPIAPDIEVFEENGRQFFMAPSPIQPPGESAIISVSFPIIGRLPGFITGTLDLGEWYMPLYFGWKHDFTYSSDDPNRTKNFAYFFEASASLRRKK